MKKMKKEADKIVKEAAKKVDPKKAQARAQKDLSKKQKVAAAWWTKYEAKVKYILAITHRYPQQDFHCGIEICCG